MVKKVNNLSNWFKRSIHSACIPLLLSAACSESAAQLSAPLQYNRKYDFSVLEQRIRGWVDSGYYNGAAIVVVRNNKPVYKSYFGTYTPNTIVHIASAGKWLAAATIATLVDEGRLNWDDKVSKWIPGFDQVKGSATLKQLLSHTAGYPAYQPNDKHVDNYQSLAESVSHIIPLPADTTPGTKFEYGGLSMQVAGRMAELATGKDWETIFREKIAIPLGLKATCFTPVDTINGGHSPMLGGGAVTTLDDYTRFLSLISNKGVFQGKRILSEITVATLEADAIGNALVSPGEFVSNARAEDRKDLYGLGLWREETGDKGNALLISSPSWAGAYPWIDRKTNTYGFFLARISNPRNGFNSFYASPVLPLLVRDAITETQHPEVKRGYIPVKQGRLFYEELGKGQPLIFVHGHSFDLHEWEPQFYQFAKKYRVIRYDVRGYGKSSMPIEFSDNRHADDLAALMDALHITKAHLVGLSMGGFIATDFLALYQHRLLSVTLASGDLYSHDGPSVPWSPEKLEEQYARNNAYMEKGIFQNKKEWFNGLTTHNDTPVAVLRKPVWNMIYKWNAWQPTHIEPRYLLGYDVIPLLQQLKITVPVMVLTGEYDYNKAKPRKIETLIKVTRSGVVPASGHVSNLENAAGFNTKLNEFLSGIKK
ncbi:alpha/beta fold hydrolase [Filimonas effusa]|uniref:Alpha/beta fold hydrolase n=1 Tax=Filimonas effusa TaxID=2508721 RepID=A0A4Q1DDS9_9BACT|nr:alpha/beta fold hydrolase [Filimonas effusa]RXK86833.1 alpha/beta fold hydrolase [Filimonas effusa]